MNDTFIKFDGNSVSATSVGSQNPLAAMIAMQLLQEMNGGLQVQNAQDAALQAVSGISGKGIQLG